MISALGRLLEASIETWHIDAEIVTDHRDDGIGLRTGAMVLCITRAPAAMPFRWVVIINERRRTAASVNGVLRIVRQTLSPGYEPRGMRVAAPTFLQRRSS